MTIDQDTGKRPFKVIVVGAGIGGIACAVECHRRGYQVSMYDAVKDFGRLGDTIGLFPNSSQYVYRWSKDLDIKLRKLCGNSFGITLRRWDGEFLTTFMREPEPGELPIKVENGSSSERPLYDIGRGDLHIAMFQYAKSIGIECHVGTYVDKYFEEADKAGIIVNGERFEADLLIAADGVKSKGRELVFGVYDKPRSSGYAIFRAFFPAQPILDNPVTRHLITDIPPGGDRRDVWLGTDAHFISVCVKNGKEFSWKVTHKDEADVEEGWVLRGYIDDVLKVVEGWDPIVQEIVKSTPPEALFDYKLVYRDPLPTWVSKHGRTVLAGDSAHPHVPTAQQGASQAIEDAVTIATCIELALPNNIKISEAMKAYELLRYNRTVATMKIGEQVRDRWHKIDLSVLPIDDDKLRLPHNPWIVDFDAEKYARERFFGVIEDIRKGNIDHYKYPRHVIDNAWVNLDTGEVTEKKI